jgi:putative hydrolase of the HAD superfamily
MPRQVATSSTDPGNKLIFFDAGGVLFDTFKDRQERILTVLRARGVPEPVCAHALDAAAVVSHQLVASGRWIATWAEEEAYWNDYYGAIAEAVGTPQPEVVSELFHLCHFVSHCELFPEVQTLLEQLQGRFRLGVISNAWPSLDWVFDRLDIRRFFESIILSAHVGCAKPDEHIYRVALASTRCQPEAAIFVDNKQRNVDAARALGIRGLWIVREGLAGDGDLYTLDDLPTKLAAL